MLQTSTLEGLPGRIMGAGPRGLRTSLTAAFDALVGPALAKGSRRDAAIRAAVDSPESRGGREILGGSAR